MGRPVSGENTQRWARVVASLHPFPLMTWLSSLGIGVLSAIIGGAAACGIASLCVGWYRISSFEGKSGYYVVAVTLAGLVVGFVIGVIASRVVAGGEAPSFLRGLGFGTGGTAAVALAVLGLTRLGADLSPTYQGRDIEVEVEVKGPVGYVPPRRTDPNGEFTASVYLVNGSRQPWGLIDVNHPRKDGDRHVVSVVVPLDTSSSSKYLSVDLGKEHRLIFSLPLRSSPGERDFQDWSKWIESGWDVGKSQPPPEERFTMRFRARPVKE